MHGARLGLLGVLSMLVACDCGGAERAEGETQPTPEPAPEQPAAPSEVELETRAWLAQRRSRQLAQAVPEGLFTGFAFVDRLPESGIDFVHRVVADAAKNYKAVHYDHGNGLAAGDVDGDGRIDLYFTTQLGPNQLWRNVGGGRFADITGAAGVALDDRVSVSAAFADFDGDGDQDLFVTTVKMGNVLFANDGSGGFEDVTERAGVGYVGHSSAAVSLDFDRDGKLDLFVANVGEYTTGQRGEGGYYIGHEDAFHGHLHPDRAERSLLYRNVGDLRFEEVGEELGLVDTGWTGDAALMDANDDGWPDLYVLNMQGDDRLWLNRRGRRFEEATARHFPKTGWGAMGVQVFDFDNDGHLDVFTTDMHSDMTEDLAPLAVERERQKAKVLMPEEMLQGGEDNLFGNTFYRGLGDGRFEEISDAVGVENYWPWGVSLGDLNADGWDDLFVTASMSYPFRYGLNDVLLNAQGERFVHAELRLGVEPRRGEATHRVWFTLDCDAWDERHELCVRCEQDAQLPECALRDEEGRLQVMGALGTRSSVIFDVDGDGDLDVVTSEFGAEPQVLISDLAERRTIRWLALELRGTRSNRDAMGAVVTLRLPDGGRRVRLVDGKTGYLSHGRVPLYFGLGGAERVEEIVVRWPSGVEQRLGATDELNRLLTIAEP